MNSIRRHVQLQRLRQSNITKAAELVNGTLMAITMGRWIVDGSCDPQAITTRIFQDLIDQKHNNIANHAENLAATIVSAVRAADFMPFTDQDFNLVSIAEQITEEKLDRDMHISNLSI